MINSINSFSNVFACTRDRIREELIKDVKHVRCCNKENVNVSLHTISFMADDLTAYNELKCFPKFLKLKYII